MNTLSRTIISGLTKKQSYLLQRKALFSSNPAVLRLKGVLQEYRKLHYTQETPTRFRKEIIQTMDADKDGYITSNDIRKFLTNIGESKQMSEEDLDMIFKEAGVNISGETVGVSTEKMIQLL